MESNDQVERLKRHREGIVEPTSSRTSINSAQSQVSIPVAEDPAASAVSDERLSEQREMLALSATGQQSGQMALGSIPVEDSQSRAVVEMGDRNTLEDPVYQSQLASLGVTVPPSSQPAHMAPLAIAALRNQAYVAHIKYGHGSVLVDGEPVSEGVRDTAVLALGRDAPSNVVSVMAHDVQPYRSQTHGSMEAYKAPQTDVSNVESYLTDVNKAERKPQIFVQGSAQGHFKRVKQWPVATVKHEVAETSLLGLVEGGIAVQRIFTTIQLFQLGVWAGISLFHMLLVLLVPRAAQSVALPPLQTSLLPIHYTCGTLCLVLTFWTLYYNLVQRHEDQQQKNNKSTNVGSVANKLPPVVLIASGISAVSILVGLLVTWATARFDADLVVVYNADNYWYSNSSQYHKRLSQIVIPSIIRCFCAGISWLCMSSVISNVVYHNQNKSKNNTTDKPPLDDAKPYIVQEVL